MWQLWYRISDSRPCSCASHPAKLHLPFLSPSLLTPAFSLLCHCWLIWPEGLEEFYLFYSTCYTSSKFNYNNLKPWLNLKRNQGQPPCPPVPSEASQELVDCRDVWACVTWMTTHLTALSSSTMELLIKSKARATSVSVSLWTSFFLFLWAKYSKPQYIDWIVYIRNVVCDCINFS